MARVGNVVEDIFGAGVVPFAEGLPRRHVVGGNLHNERGLVVAWRDGRVVVVVVGEGDIETEGVVLADGEAGRNQPIVGVGVVEAATHVVGAQSVGGE